MVIHPCSLRIKSIGAMLSVGLLLPASMALATEPPLIQPEAKWTTTSIFEKQDKDDKFVDQPRLNLSGAACAPTTPKFTSCLIANDEKRYAQFFSIKDNVLTPGQLILLSKADKDPDAEAVAYGAGYFYITGSHGRSRHSDKPNDSSYAVFRFPVNTVTGVPAFEISSKTVADAIKVSDRLREPLSKEALLQTDYNKPLAAGGINIEGMAVTNGRIYFGLRGPSRGGVAYVLSVDAEALFTKTDDLKSKVTPLQLGENIGIRDLAAVDDGILVLAGPTRSENVPYSIWHWDGASETAKPLARLALEDADKEAPEGKAKAEILLPLSEDKSGYRVLIMFDGVENGGARSFIVKR